MLSMEKAEIGGTLIALTISGPKPLIDKVFSELDGIAENTAAAAMAFNMAYILVSEWARRDRGVERKENYCPGVSGELDRTANRKGKESLEDSHCC